MSTSTFRTVMSCARACPEFPRKLHRKSTAAGPGISKFQTMFLVTIVLVQLIYSADTLCVWERGDGVRLACGFRQSGLFRLRNFGGVKSWVGLGLSVGDENGLKESMTNVETAESGRSLGNAPTVSVPVVKDYFIRNEDENSDEIPEDDDDDKRKRRFGIYEEPSTTVASASDKSKSKTKLKNDSFEKRKLDNSHPKPAQNSTKKMTVSVNIPAFEPMPLEFELSSRESGSIGKLMNVSANSIQQTPAVGLKQMYKKTTTTTSASNVHKRKKPFRIQLLENTEQIADDYKSSRNGEAGSTLLIPTTSLPSKLKPHQTLSKALLRQYAETGSGSRSMSDSGLQAFDNDAESQNPDRVLRPSPSEKEIQRFRTSHPNGRHLTRHQVEEHLLNLQRHPGHGPGRNQHNNQNRRNFPRGPGPKPPPRNFPRHPPPPKPDSRNFPPKMSGPPGSPNSVRLPLSVLKKYMPKPRNWPGGRNGPPPPRRPNHQKPPRPMPPNQKHHHHRHPPPKHSGPNPDLHLAGSINHPHHRNKAQHPGMTSPWNYFPETGMGGRIPGGPTQYIPQPSMSYAIPPSRNRPAADGSSEHNLSKIHPSKSTIVIKSPASSGSDQPQVHEKESILHALKTLSQAKPDVIKSIVKDGSLPQGVINVVTLNDTKAHNSSSMDFRQKPMESNFRNFASPTSNYQQFPRPSSSPTALSAPHPHSVFVPAPPTMSASLYQTIRDGPYQSGRPSSQFPAAQSHSQTSVRFVPLSSAPAPAPTIIHHHHYPNSHEAVVPQPDDHEDQPDDPEEDEDPTSMYTEKLNEISTKLSEMPDNEEFITLPIDDVLSMLLATTQAQAGGSHGPPVAGRSGEYSQEFISNYYGGSRGGGGGPSHEDDDGQLSSKQTELGKILYDMGIIHRIAAGNLTLSQMAIVNKLIDLNQNERLFSDEMLAPDEDEEQQQQHQHQQVRDDYEDSPPDHYHEAEFVPKKQPAKYVLPNSYNPDMVEVPYSSIRPTPGSYETGRPVPTPTLQRTTTSTRRPAVPIPEYHEYQRNPSHQEVDYQKHTKTNEGVNLRHQHHKSQSGQGQGHSITKTIPIYKNTRDPIDEKVIAALKEYNSNQIRKTTNHLFARRNGNANGNEHPDSESESEFSESRRKEMLRREYLSRRERDDEFEPEHQPKELPRRSEQKRVVSETQRPAATAATSKLSSIRRRSGTGRVVEVESNSDEADVVIIRPTSRSIPRQRQQYHHQQPQQQQYYTSSSSSSSSSMHHNPAFSSRRLAISSNTNSAATGPAPMMVDFDGLL